MRKLGFYLALFGAISSAMSFFDYELGILMWIDNWGETVGWCIRGGMVVVGLGMWSRGAKKYS